MSSSLIQKPSLMFTTFANFRRGNISQVFL
jgi:hypothetical protein